MQNNIENVENALNQLDDLLLAPLRPKLRNFVRDNLLKLRDDGQPEDLFELRSKVSGLQRADSDFQDETQDLTNEKRELLPGFGSKLFLTGDYEVALSGIIAAYAHLRSDVIGFRESYLSNLLLPSDEIERWIFARDDEDRQTLVRRKAKKKTRPSRSRRIPNSHFELANPEISEEDVPTLSYVIPDETKARRVRVSPAGILNKLRELTERLATLYHWNPEDATVFVLSGGIPVIDRIRISPSRRYSTRINLDIDLSLTAEEVADVYRSIRKFRIKRYLPKNRDRFKLPSERKIALGLYAFQKTATHEEWRMEEWNRLVPKKWRDSSTGNFKRDCRDGSKLLEQALTLSTGIQTHLYCDPEFSPTRNVKVNPNPKRKVLPNSKSRHKTVALEKKCE